MRYAIKIGNLKECMLGHDEEHGHTFNVAMGDPRMATWDSTRDVLAFVKDKKLRRYELVPLPDSALVKSAREFVERIEHADAALLAGVPVGDIAAIVRDWLEEQDG